jgi:hypothetical protein
VGALVEVPVPVMGDADACASGRASFSRWELREAARFWQQCAENDVAGRLALGRSLQLLAMGREVLGANTTVCNGSSSSSGGCGDASQTAMRIWGKQADGVLRQAARRFYAARGTATALLAEIEQHRQGLAATAAPHKPFGVREGRAGGRSKPSCIGSSLHHPPRWAWRHGDSTYFRSFLPQRMRAIAHECSNGRQRGVPSDTDSRRCFSRRVVEEELLVRLRPQGGVVWDTAAAGAGAAAAMAQRIRQHGCAVIGGGLSAPSRAGAGGSMTPPGPTLLPPHLLEALRAQLSGVAARAAQKAAARVARFAVLKQANEGSAAEMARFGTPPVMLNGVPVPVEMAPIRGPHARRHHMLSLADDFGSSPSEEHNPAARALQLLARALLPLFARLTPPDGDGRSAGAGGMRRMAISEMTVIEALPTASSQMRHADILPDVEQYCGTCHGNSTDIGGAAGPQGEEEEVKECVCGRRTWSVFVPLNDVAYEGGATQMWPGSHRHLLNVDHAAVYELGSGLDVENDKRRIAEENAKVMDDDAPCDGDGNSLVDHFDPLGVRLAVRAGSLIVYNSRLVHRGRRHAGDTPRPLLVLTLVEDGFELPESGLLSPDGGLKGPAQKVSQGGATPRGSTDALLPRYGESGAWRLSLADLASGRGWLLDEEETKTSKYYGGFHNTSKRTP